MACSGFAGACLFSFVEVSDGGGTLRGHCGTHVILCVVLTMVGMWQYASHTRMSVFA